jgi:hypothetical protein
MQGTSMAAPFVARQLATTFVSASDQDVSRAERANYLPLLHGLRVRDHQSLRKDRLGEVKARLEELKDRLGVVLVAPHWQPGIED